MKTCKDCKWYYISCTDIQELTPKSCLAFEQRTNFDRVTASPEALAEYIDWAIDEAWGGRCPLIKSGKCAEHLKCKDCIAEWLKQKAEDEE